MVSTVERRVAKGEELVYGCVEGRHEVCAIESVRLKRALRHVGAGQEVGMQLRILRGVPKSLRLEALELSYVTELVS